MAIILSFRSRFFLADTIEVYWFMLFATHDSYIWLKVKPTKLAKGINPCLLLLFQTGNYPMTVDSTISKVMLRIFNFSMGLRLDWTFSVFLLNGLTRLIWFIHWQFFVLFPQDNSHSACSSIISFVGLCVYFFFCSVFFVYLCAGTRTYAQHKHTHWQCIYEFIYVCCNPSK